MDPDQTASLEAVWSGFILLRKRALNHIVVEKSVCNFSDPHHTKMEKRVFTIMIGVFRHNTYFEKKTVFEM